MLSKYSSALFFNMLCNAKNIELLKKYTYASYGSNVPQDFWHYFLFLALQLKLTRKIIGFPIFTKIGEIDFSRSRDWIYYLCE